MNGQSRIAGLTAVFNSPDDVLSAARGIRSAGYQRFDFHTPYPLHGLDEAMGVRRTVLPWIALAGGVLGLAVAVHLQWWTGAVDYPLTIGGKPFFAFEPSIPIMFELTVLLTAIATTIGMFALNGLPKWYSKWQGSENFRRATDDAFVVTIDASDPKYSEERTRELLARLGAQDIRVVEYHEE